MKITEDLNLYVVVDECYILAKNKQEVLDFYTQEFGTPKELLNISEKEFLEDVIPVREDRGSKLIKVLEDETGKIIETTLKYFSFSFTKSAPCVVMWITY